MASAFHQTKTRRLLALTLLTSAGLMPAQAAEVVIPLTVPFDFLTMAMTRKPDTPSGDAAVINYQSGCGQLSLDHPQFGRQQELIRFVSHGTGSAGVEVFDTCLNPINWRGYIEILAIPSITQDWQLHLKIDHSNLYDDAWQKGLLTGPIWDLAQTFVLPSVSDLTIDLTPPRNEALSMLKEFARPDRLMQLDAVFRSAKAKAIRVDDLGVNVDMSLMLPDQVHQKQMAASAVAPLGPEELKTVQQSLEQWDAFLVFVIKEIGGDDINPYLREQLFDLLFTSRYRVLSILSGESDTGGVDPVRSLFIETWTHLQRIIKNAEEQGIELGHVLRYAAFIRAVDVLLAIDRAAPDLGLEISADGLRRLARILQPEFKGDPLIYNVDPDPQLRELFGFPAQLPEEEPLDPLPEDTDPQAGFLGLVKSAYAEKSNPNLDLEALTKRLNLWVPEDSELNEYRSIMNRLLLLTSDREMQSSALNNRHKPVFRNLMQATALKESCWRQFVRKSKKITYLRSAAGSIGLMQINPYVWRGFYKLDQLKWRAHYNAEAGAEILLHYWRQYASKEEKTGSIDNIARSAYAIYNAGPGASDRYREKNSSLRERKVDKRFWEIYRGFKANQSVDLFDCTVR